MSTSRVGSVFAPNCCKNPTTCAICSGKYHTLTPVEQKRALASISHDPTQYSPPQKKCKPLSPEQIEQKKKQYQKKSKPIVPRSAHWEYFITKEDFAAIDRAVEEAYQRPHLKPGMLIDVNGQDEEAAAEEKKDDVASILLALKEAT